MSHGSFTIEQAEPRPAAVVRGHVEHDGIGAFIGASIREVMHAIGAQHVQPAGEPFAQYRLADDGTFDIAVGFPVTSPVSASDGVVPMSLPAGTVARTTVTGPYAEIGSAYDALIAWIDASGYEMTGDFLERYLDGPDAPSPRTVIEVPCRRA